MHLQTNDCAEGRCKECKKTSAALKAFAEAKKAVDALRPKVASDPPQGKEEER